MFHDEGWICSVEMGTSTPQNRKLHFPPPSDWLSTNDELPICCTSTGGILIVKEHDIAVVRGGWNCAEVVLFKLCPSPVSGSGI